MADAFNKTGACIAVYVVFATIDESRKRTPNKNHDPESGNVIPNTNHSKPIHNAYEIHDIACANDNITFGMRPTYGAQDREYSEYLTKKKDEDVEVKKMTFVVCKLLDSVGFLNDSLLYPTKHPITRLILADGAFISVNTARVLSGYNILISGPVKTSHTQFPLTALKLLPCKPAEPTQITVAFLVKTIDYVQYSPRPPRFTPMVKKNPDHSLRLWLTRFPFTKDVNQLSNYAHGDNVSEYTAFSALEYKATHLKTVTAAAYSKGAGSVDRANRFIAQLGLGESKPTRSRFLVRVFQWKLSFIVSNVVHFHNTISDRLGIPLNREKFWRDLLEGLAWFTHRIGHTTLAYYNQKEYRDWFKNPTFIPKSGRNQPNADCSSCGKNTTLRWCVTCNIGFQNSRPYCSAWSRHVLQNGVVTFRSNWNIFAAPHPHNHNDQHYVHYFIQFKPPLTQRVRLNHQMFKNPHLPILKYQHSVQLIHTTNPSSFTQHCILAKTSGRISSIFYTKSIFEQIKKHPKITLSSHLTSIQPSTPILPPKTPPHFFLMYSFMVITNLQYT